MSKIKCIYYNIHTKKAELMTINDKLEEYYKLIDCESIEIVTVMLNGKYTQIICDEEARLKPRQIVSAQSLKYIDSFLLGNLIILSDDKTLLDKINEEGMVFYV